MSSADPPANRAQKQAALPRRRVSYGWWMVGGLSVTELVSWGVLVYAFSVLVVPMRAELGWSLGQMNAAFAVGIAVSGVMAIPVGRWLQWRGPRELMTLGSVLAVGVLLGWSQVSSLSAFFALFVLAGLAMAMTLYEPAFAVAASWFTARRARAVLVLTIFGGLASVVFLPLTGFLVDRFDWRTALVVLAVVTAVTGIPIHALVLRNRPPMAHSDTGEARDEAATSGSAQASDGESGWPGDIGRKAAVRSASFRWFTVGLVSATLAKVAVSVVLVAYLTDRGYPLSQASLAAGAVGLFQIIGRIVLTLLARYVHEHWLSGAFFAAQGVGFALPLLTTGTGTTATVSVVIFVVVFGFAFGLPELLRGTRVADYYGPSHYASINAVLATFTVGARAVGPFLAGLVVTALDSYVVVFLAAAALAMAGAVATTMAHRVHGAETYQRWRGDV